MTQREKAVKYLKEHDLVGKLLTREMRAEIIEETGTSHSTVACAARIAAGLSPTKKGDGRRLNTSRSQGIKKTAIRRSNTMTTENAGISGFKDLHNYADRQRRRQAQVLILIQKVIDKHLRRLAYIEEHGGLEEGAPRGWFYDTQGPSLAAVSTRDWALHREEFDHIQMTVDTDKGSNKLVWVDPDAVEEYKAALED